MLGVIFIPKIGRKDDIMAKAKKLPSGKWRTLAFDHTDEIGKRHYKSFTADTKKESEYLAAQYITGRSTASTAYENINVGEAIKKYIEIKKTIWYNI